MTKTFWKDVKGTTFIAHTVTYKDRKMVIAKVDNKEEPCHYCGYVSVPSDSILTPLSIDAIDQRRFGLLEPITFKGRLAWLSVDVHPNPLHYIFVGFDTAGEDITRIEAIKRTMAFADQLIRIDNGTNS